MGVSADGIGNVYLTGVTYGSLGGPYSGGGDTFVGRYDSSGKLVWVRQLGANGQDVARGVSADRLGNVFIVGDTGAPTGAGGPTAGLIDTYVAKYDASGTLHWVRQLGTAQHDVGFSISADGLGNVYLSGLTEGTLAGTYAGNGDAFVSKYDVEGNRLWVRQFGTAAQDGSRGVAADVLGNVYLAISTEGDLGGSNQGGFDVALSKLDPTGNLVWTKQFGTSGDDRSRSVSTDPMGNVYTAGFTTGSLGGPNAGGYDAFVSKHDASGNLLWARQLGTSLDEGCCVLGNPDSNTVSVATDNLGNVYLGSFTKGSFGPNSGAGEPFVAKYDATGNLHWIEQFALGASQVANSVSPDGLGNVYVSLLVRPTGNVLGGGPARIAKFSDDAPVLPAGDFNADGTVNAADYVVWRNGLGTRYTQADYNTWRSHFGQTAGSAGATAGLTSSANAAVPEPGTAAVALLTIAPLLLLYRAHHAGLTGWKHVWKPDRTTDELKRPRPARLGGAMFDSPPQQTSSHADKLRGEEAFGRVCVWFSNIGPRSKLLWCRLKQSNPLEAINPNRCHNAKTQCIYVD
jgi:hypothetical protein